MLERARLNVDADVAAGTPSSLHCFNNAALPLMLTYESLLKLMSRARLAAVSAALTSFAVAYDMNMN
jgi:hypothetical protein